MHHAHGRSAHADVREVPLRKSRSGASRLERNELPFPVQFEGRSLIRGGDSQAGSKLDTARGFEPANEHEQNERPLRAHRTDAGELGDASLRWLAFCGDLDQLLGRRLERAPQRLDPLDPLELRGFEPVAKGGPQRIGDSQPNRIVRTGDTGETSRESAAVQHGP